MRDAIQELGRELRREMRVPRASRRELRHFGLGLAGAVLVVTGVLAWKGASAWPLPLAVAILLVALAAVAPAALAPLWRVWMPAARAAGFFVSRLLLVALYYFVITPIAWIVRRFRKDPLDRKMRDRESYWVRRKVEDYDPANSERMF